jgi:hypothetical protein
VVGHKFWKNTFGTSQELPHKLLRRRSVGARRPLSFISIHSLILYSRYSISTATAILLKLETPSPVLPFIRGGQEQIHAHLRHTFSSLSSAKLPDSSPRHSVQPPRIIYFDCEKGQISPITTLWALAQVGSAPCGGFRSKNAVQTLIHSCSCPD